MTFGWKALCLFHSSAYQFPFPSIVTVMGTVAIVPGETWSFQESNADLVLKIL